MSEELTTGVNQPNTGHQEAGSPDAGQPQEQPSETVFEFEDTSPTDQPGVTSPPDGPPPAETPDQGLVTRLEQRQAKLTKALQAVGIDPDSTMIDQLEAGILSAEDLKARVIPSPSVQQPQPAQPPEPTPKEKISEVVARVREKGDATLQDFETLATGIVDFMSRSEATEQQSAFERNINSCRDAVFNVFENQDSVLPDELKTTEREIFLAATDHNVTTDANQSGAGARMLNPQTYDYYANQAVGEFAKIRNAYIEHGRQLERAARNPNPSPAPAEKIITPTAPGQGPPITKPKIKVNMDNVTEARQRYLASLKTPV